jgi:hypothetical protein
MKRCRFRSGEIRYVIWDDGSKNGLGFWPFTAWIKPFYSRLRPHKATLPTVGRIDLGHLSLFLMVSVFIIFCSFRKKKMVLLNSWNCPRIIQMVFWQLINVYYRQKKYWRTIILNRFKSRWFKRGSARIPDNMAGEKFLIFDLTILK